MKALKKMIPLGVIGLIGANMLGWTFYDLMKIIVSNGLTSMGVVNPIYQDLMIIGVGTVIVVVAGVKLKEVLD